MNDKPALHGVPKLPRDEDARDQDRPLNLRNAADHRPDAGSSDPGDGTDAVDEDQNDSANEPNPAILQKQQRSQGMNQSS